jgi:sugar phosphate isomerase/epimerase
MLGKSTEEWHYALGGWGRTVGELTRTFVELPAATLCFDIGHARRCDTSMTEAYKILKKFGARLKQVHVSEVNTTNRHDPISYAANIAFHEAAHLIPSNIAALIESRVTQPEIRRMHSLGSPVS